VSDKIEIIFKGTKIEFDTRKEEWVAKLNTDYSIGEDTFKRHTSLQKLKDAIDRFNKKEFKPIPILFFSDHGDTVMKSAEIISFTDIPGECWIRYADGRREKIDTVKRGFSYYTKIYACENIFNEPIFSEIIGVNSEIKTIEKELEQKKKQRIHLIDSLQVFDIVGYAVSSELEE
jgi:hypothetical protein